MRRVLLVAILLYLVADYSDPGTPGVFFFDTEAFFVDAAIQHRGAPMRPTPLGPSLPVLGEAPEASSEAFRAMRPIDTATSVAFVPARPTARDGYLPVKTPAEDS